MYQVGMRVLGTQTRGYNKSYNLSEKKCNYIQMRQDVTCGAEGQVEPSVVGEQSGGNNPMTGCCH